MKKLLRCLSTIMMLSLLMGCEELHEKNYNWYMQHPMELKKEIAHCESSMGQDKYKDQCEMILRAAVNITAIVTQYQANPEKFGNVILNAQEQLMQLQLQLEQREKDCDNTSPLDVKE